MATDKKISYKIQGGVKNYKPSKMVTAPKTAKSSPKHPTAHLAYITKKEQDLLVKKNLYGSLKGKPNKGPAGIVSLQGDFGPGGTGGSYGGHEGPDRSGSKDRGTGNYGVTDRAVQDAYNKNRAIREHNERAVDKLHGRDTRLSGGINTTNRWGGLGGLLRGALGVFGGIPGRIFGALSTAKNWAKNKAVGIGDEFEEFKGYDNFADYLNRNKNPALGNDLGLAVNRQNAPIGPGKRVGEDTGFYGMGSQYDASRMPSNLSPNMGANNFLNNTADENDPNFLGAMAKDGGRIGYAFGRGPVLDENVDESTIDIMNDQGVPHSEMVGKSPFELRIDELMDEGMSWQEAYTIASEEFGQVVEGESDQGIASIV